MTIDLRNITKTYGNGEIAVRVLKGISVTIQDGEMCAIMGPSGSGKSTLMNIIGLLDTPTEGEYLLDGQERATLDADTTAQIRNRKIGFVFQSYNLIKRTSAIDNVQLPLLYAGVPPVLRRARAEAALRAVGLGAHFDRLPTALSGGQQQRVAIARAIAMRPSLILADEPTGALDSKSSVEVMNIFQRLNQRLGITVVFVTHEPDIAQYTRRVLHIRDGYLESDERVRHPRVAADELRRQTRSGSMPHETAGCSPGAPTVPISERPTANISLARCSIWSDLPTQFSAHVPVSWQSLSSPPPPLASLPYIVAGSI